MKKFLFLIVFMALSAGTGLAETARMPLSRLAPVSSVDIRCINGSYEVSIPVPERWSISKASVSVRYINSTNLIPEISQLVIKLNGAPVGQVRLNPSSPEGRVEVPLPLHMLEPGYNRLSFQAAQHYSRQCESPCSPDLWTTVKLDETFLQVDYGLKAVPLRASAIADFLFDPRLLPNGEVNIISEGLTSEGATLAGIAASGVAMRFDYRKVFFNHSNDLRPGVDNVLIGKKEFAENFLRQRGIDPRRIQGPYLRVAHMPNDPLHGIVVISGTTPEEIKTAVRTFTSLSFPYPGTDELQALALKKAKVQDYSGRVMIDGKNAHTFKSLDYSTHTFRGYNPGPREIIFRLPADFMIKDNQYAALTLNFSYGAGLRAESALNMELNGKAVKAINLSNPKGDLIERYRIDIPTYLLKPGMNSLVFSPQLFPAGKECDMMQSEGLFLTLFDNSSIQMPGMPHFVEMPRMDMFMLNGFPFTRRPDGSDSVVYITKADNNTLSSALNLLGLMTQKNGYPLSEIKVNIDKPDSWKKDMVIIGGLESLPEDLKNRAPMRLSKQAVIPYPVLNTIEGEGAFALSTQASGMGQGNALLMEFQSPYKTGRTALVLTGSSTREILSLSQLVLDPSVQARASGDIVWADLNNGTYKISAMGSGVKYFTGKSGKMSMLDSYMFIYPYLYYIFLALLIGLLSFTISFVLRKFRKRRMPDAQ